MSPFPALPRFYQTIFMYLEPLSTMIPALLVWTVPGSSWFHQELIPAGQSAPSATPLDPRTKMAIWQLANCYLLLGLISSFTFRAIKEALPHNPQAQERIVSAILAALAVADVTHIVATVIGLPSHLRFSVVQWNSMVHGNVTAVIALLGARLAWFMGIGRTRYNLSRKVV
ncbi:hypothetical protein AMATHDRAFT_134070 [Amanita thiersii Skay4041]|uniref:DUF7704 domain-containing protein n=1 Tax=Amanita thiersii Skay4041 TaxID=703135 RepID=A0A2A9P1K8_9AGAR|nr:hypothetical protein AMATHDRAFT_134070 [Amanita thiersii Skay4041]